MTGAVPGLMLVTVAAVANATSTLPMKFARHWAWENIWLVWSFLALMILPASAAILFIPSLALVYREAGPVSVAIVAVCGAGWGLAQVLFGLSVDAIGIGLAFSKAHGASAQQVVYAVWLLLLIAGAVPSLLYCVHLLGRKHTWGNFRSQHAQAYGLLALLMALLWFFSTALYGIATRWLGNLGIVVYWPVFMSLIVVTASLLGILTGEWKRSGRAPVLLQLSGMLLLVLAVVAFSRAQYSSTSATHAVIQHASAVLHTANSGTMDRFNVR